MSRIISLLLILVCLCGFSPPTQTDASNAQRAYLGFLNRFWVGSATNGHIATINGNNLTQSANIIPIETPAQLSWLWSYVSAWNVLYVYWKTAPAGDPLKADALQRLQSHWAWTKATWGTIKICGAVPGTDGQGMDDSTWDGSGLIQMYDATNDPAALQAAADMLSCGYNRWYTSDMGGGLVYCDPGYCNGAVNYTKYNYNGTFGLAMIECAQRGCSSSTISNSQMAAYGKALVDWTNTTLLRSVSVCPQPDNIYWMGVNLINGVTTIAENSCPKPNLINPSGSITQLSLNMLNAAANSKLSATYGSTYTTLAQNTAASILQKEMDPNGVLMNDRDARTAVYGLYPFLLYTYPQLSPSLQASWRQALLSTAHSIERQGNLGTGLYRPDWDPIWNQSIATYAVADQLDVGPQQAVIIICARQFGY